MVLLNSSAFLVHLCVTVFTERKVKVKLSLTIHEDSEVGWNVGLPTLLWHRHNTHGTAVSYTHRPHFTPKEIPWYSFLLQAEWPAGLPNAARRNRSLENFQGPYLESNRYFPSCGAVLQPTAELALLTIGCVSVYMRTERLVIQRYDMSHHPGLK